jgi:hypothetical protein
VTKRSLTDRGLTTLTCHEAERAISQTLDGLLDGRGIRVLRRHQDGCVTCGRLERVQRAQQAALRALADVSVPASLRSFDPTGRV